MKDEAWVGLLGADPRPWLLESQEPAARWVALTGLLDLNDDNPEVIAARHRVIEDPGTRELISRLADWEADTSVSGHNSPGYAPNLLELLADMGIRGGDDPRIERLLDRMLAHQEDNGRFASFGRASHGKNHRGETAGGSGQAAARESGAVWGALLCDSHAITEALVRFGRGDDPRTRAAIERMAADLVSTAQGRAWPCVPHPVNGFRGPGRKADFCPQVTLEAVRTFARFPVGQRPDALRDALRTSVRAWRERAAEKPYMFGHGRGFKTVKWPTFWYDVYRVLDTLGRYPELWREGTACSEDRRALAEMAACLVAYNFDPGGTVTPRSCYQGFAGFSFGQKKRPSPFATARLSSVLRRFDDLVDEIRAVDVLSLPSSKGGSGTPLPPRR